LLDEDVKEETAANPLAAIAAELAVYLQNAIQALQATEKRSSPPAPRRLSSFFPSMPQSIRTHSIRTCFP
jgi:hypothetical protein